jgi:hypothetical protein
MQNQITLQEAKQLITEYRNNRDKILAPQYQGTNILCNSITYSRSSLLELLNQEGCAGFRTYFGMKAENSEVCLVLVGVDGNGKDITDKESIILDAGNRCPDVCPPLSDLNP